MIGKDFLIGSLLIFSLKRYGEEGMEEASKYHGMHEGDGVEAAEDVRATLEVMIRSFYS